MDLEKLYAAALAGDTEAIAKLEKKADRLNKHDRTILHIESIDGNIERVRNILTMFKQKNLLAKLDTFKQTALHLAADHGHTQVVELLIDAARALSSPLNDDMHSPVGSYLEAFVRQVDEKMNTALHLAVSNHHMDIVKLIVEADPSDRHIQNHNDETPIYIAAKLGYPDVVRLICNACPAPSLDGPHGTSALHRLIGNWNDQEKYKYVFTVHYLLEAAKRSACEEDAAYNSFEALFKITDEDGYNVLQLAVMGNNRDAVEMILDEDPAYQHKCSNKNSDLQSLAYIAAEKGYKDTVKLLCQTYEARNEIGRVGQTTLHAAIIGRDRGAAFDLLEGDPHLVRWEDHRGWTPLHYAAYHGFDTILDKMLAKQDEVGYQFVPTENIPPPLFVAVEQGHISTVKRYLNDLAWEGRVGRPMSTDDLIHNGQNILHVMASRRNKEMLKTVLAYFEDKTIDILNHKDSYGNTPLHILFREGCYVPEFIRSDMIDKNATNHDGWTPIDMLYFRDDLTDDQVRIRIEIDNIQAKQKWKFWHRSIVEYRYPSVVSLFRVEKETEIFMKAKRLLIEEEIKRKKDKFKLVKDDLERYRQRTNTQIIVTALITTVTFTVGFTLPGGYHQSGEPDQGLVLLSRKTAFKAFMVSDALALVLSTSSLFFYFISSMYDDPLQVSKLNAVSTVLNIVSVIGMMLTFTTGTYVVLSHSPALAITVCLICCFFFIIVIVQSIKMIYDRGLEKIHIV